MRLLPLVFFASPAVAASFDRPIPNAQSATAELWFGLASLLLLLALVGVGWLVRRR